MKLSKFIEETEKFLEQLEKARVNYKLLYDKEPYVSSICEDDGLVLCAGLKREGSSTISLKPYEKDKSVRKYVEKIRDGAYGV
jgi:hypothetical protein